MNTRRIRTRAISPTHGLGVLVRLRYLAVLAQATTLGIVGLGLRAALPFLPLALLVGFTLATNVAVHAFIRVRRSRPEPVGGHLVNAHSSAVVGVLVALDVVILTGLLACSGGPANPFTVLYLIHVVLAAMIASAAWMWLVVVLSSAGYGLLFFFAWPLPAELGGEGHHGVSRHDLDAHDHHAEMVTSGYSAHLQGMWLAYTLAAISIGASVSWLAQALRLHREERGRTERLLGLATLAAGAAHEIGNPLATIRLAASELDARLRRDGAAPELIEDLDLIQKETGRAAAVLRRMAIGAGELRGEAPTPMTVVALCQRLESEFGRDRVCFEGSGLAETVHWPAEAVVQALSQIVRNGLEAAPHEAVRVTVASHGATLLWSVTDTGPGLGPDALARLGEPFFTTKTGEGRGLGVFIARTLIEHLGGRLVYRRPPGGGTQALAELPVRLAVGGG